MKTEDIKKLLKPKDKKPARFLSTGSSLLNLAVSGKVNGGFLVGTYDLFVGDSNSGKTVFGKAFLAEALISKAFDDYDLYYDNTEHGDRINTAKMFPVLHRSNRVKAPRYDSNGSPVYSETVEDLYGVLRELTKSKRPFIYICDSETALSCKADIKKSDKNDDKGSYGTEKAKIHSRELKRLMGPLERTGSIVIFVNQTRDRIGFGAQFNPKTRAGGRALEFFSTVQMWSSVRERIKRKAAGKKRKVGILSKIEVKRTRITGKDSYVEIPIYYSSGIDDVGSMISWLVEERHWKGSKELDGNVEAPEFKFSGSREDLVKKIEAEGSEKELKAIVSETWQAIEDSCKVERKNRYE